ncbi:hypothetical protein ACOSP7_018875 [Xanthoceras sorbifolium]
MLQKKRTKRHFSHCSIVDLESLWALQHFLHDHKIPPIIVDFLFQISSSSHQPFWISCLDLHWFYFGSRRNPIEVDWRNWYILEDVSKPIFDVLLHINRENKSMP